MWNKAKPSTCTTWRKVKGPLSAAYLSLKRLGWNVESPFVFIDDQMRRIKLTDHSPCMMGNFLRSSYIRSIERKAAVRLYGNMDPPRRVWMEPARKAINSRSRKFDARGKGIIKALVTDAVWTGARAADAGYTLDSLCPLCRKERDTLKNRLYYCCAPDVMIARSQAVPQRFLHAAIGALRGEGDALKAAEALFMHGIPLNPADLAPSPNEHADGLAWDGQGNQIHIYDVGLHGNVFFMMAHAPDPCAMNWRVPHGVSFVLMMIPTSM